MTACFSLEMGYLWSSAGCGKRKEECKSTDPLVSISSAQGMLITVMVRYYTLASLSFLVILGLRGGERSGESGVHFHYVSKELSIYLTPEAMHSTVLEDQIRERHSFHQKCLALRRRLAG
jgi:hypothetical protein